MIPILVVEDDAKLNQVVCTYLNDSGFHATGCFSAAEAYDEMYNNLYELIISDIMMPGIDGFEFAQTVRQVNKQRLEYQQIKQPFHSDCVNKQP